MALRGKSIVTPTITGSYVLNDCEIDFCKESLDYLYHYAAMIHFVRVARSKMTWEEQIKDFFSGI